MIDYLPVMFRKWFVEKVRSMAFPRESFGSYDVAPGLYKIHSGMATVAGGEVARLRCEGYDDDVIRATLGDERSLEMACEALDLEPGTQECEVLREGYGIAVEAAIGILRRLYPNEEGRK